MKRIFFTLFFLLMLLAGAKAQNAMLIHYTEPTASDMVIVLQDKPVVSFAGDSIIVSSDDGSKVSLDMTKVDYFKYDVNSTIITDITGITDGGDGDGLSMRGNHIYLSGLPAGSPVYLYDTVGKIYKSLKADSEGKCDISIDDLARGVYIVKAYHISTKISKK